MTCTGKVARGRPHANRDARPLLLCHPIGQGGDKRPPGCRAGVSSDLPEKGREGSECSFSEVRVTQVCVLGVCRGLSTDPKHVQEQEAF